MTNASLLSINIERPATVIDQISKQVRSLIKEEKFAPGSRLPSTAALAKMWGSDVKSVHFAMTRLVKESLIYRKAGVGTFVRELPGALQKVCLYYPPKALGSRGSLFQESLYESLTQELEERGIEIQVWVDSRTGAAAAEACDLLTTAARHREFQGIIAPLVDLAHLQWLLKLPVPTAFQSSADIPNKVDSDLKQFAAMSFRILAEKGCRTVALICPFSVTEGIRSHSLDGTPDTSGHYFHLFSDAAKGFGLRLMSEGMSVRGQGAPPDAVASGDYSQEQMGYEQFHAVWREPEKPQGIVVYPDTFVRGVLLGIAETGVRVPEDLKLVLHKNAGIDLFCPYPADLVISEERDIAKALVNQLETQFSGKPVSPLHFTFHQAATLAWQPPVCPGALSTATKKCSG